MAETEICLHLDLALGDEEEGGDSVAEEGNLETAVQPEVGGPVESMRYKDQGLSLNKHSCGSI